MVQYESRYSLNHYSHAVIVKKSLSTEMDNWQRGLSNSASLGFCYISDVPFSLIGKSFFNKSIKPETQHQILCSVSLNIISNGSFVENDFICYGYLEDGLFPLSLHCVSFIDMVSCTIRKMAFLSAYQVLPKDLG